MAFEAILSTFPGKEAAVLIHKYDMYDGKKVTLPHDSVIIDRTNRGGGMLKSSDAVDCS